MRKTHRSRLVMMILISGSSLKLTVPSLVQEQIVTLIPSRFMDQAHKQGLTILVLLTLIMLLAFRLEAVRFSMAIHLSPLGKRFSQTINDLGSKLSITQSSKTLAFPVVPPVKILPLMVRLACQQNRNHPISKL